MDLGATGTGLAADLAAEAALDAMDGGGVLVALGGDIATDGATPPGGWRIQLSDDLAASPDGRGEVVRIDGGAIATAGSSGRRRSRGGPVTRGGLVSHRLLAPGMGLPAAGPWRAATVVAATCADAHAAATAALAMGECAPTWLVRNGLPARLIAEDGTVVRVAGWPRPVAELRGIPA